MWRSAVSVAVNTGRELYHSARPSCPQRQFAPIIARVLRRPTRLCPGAVGNRTLATVRQLFTVRFSTVRGRCIPYTLMGSYSLQQITAGSCGAFCTATKPAVVAPDQIPPRPPEEVMAAVSTREETNPWLLRHQVVTFNHEKRCDRPQGVTFNAGYMDTGADWHDDKKAVTPTVLAIPGQPGSHEDMLPVVRALHEDRPAHRVVVVNMPGYDFTKGLTPDDGEYYDNSSTDLAEFVFRFVEALQLHRIDMVVTHSAGSIPLLILIATSDLIRSAMIICTPSLHVPSRVCRPLWFIKGLVNAWNTPTGRRFLSWYLPKFNRLVGWLNTDDPNQLITSAKFGAYSDFELMDRLSADIRAKKTPMVYVASKNDKLVELRLSMDWAGMLGVDKTMFDVYDEQYMMVKRADMHDGQVYPKGVLLAKGGHYPQRKEVALPVLRHEAKVLMTQILRDHK